MERSMREQMVRLVEADLNDPAQAKAFVARRCRDAHAALDKVGDKELYLLHESLGALTRHGETERAARIKEILGSIDLAMRRLHLVAGELDR